MSREGTLARVAGAVALLALAVVLTLLAVDVLGWRGQNDRAAVGVAAASPDLGIWQPSTIFPVAWSQSLLGTEDDVRLGQAIQRFQLVRAGGPDAFAQNNRRAAVAEAELELDRLATAAETARARSQARTLHAILLYSQLRDQTADPLIPLLRMSDELRKAVRTDPGNAAAKYDLEAILNVVAPLGAAAAQADLPEKGANKGSRVGGGGSGGSVSSGGGF
jgi:uncharacterized membrane protein YgcG